MNTEMWYDCIETKYMNTEIHEVWLHRDNFSPEVKGNEDINQDQHAAFNNENTDVCSISYKSS